MKKLLLVILCFLMLCTAQVFAQSRTVTGTVTAKDDGLPVPGVTVKIKGTTTAVQTNTIGKYKITVTPGAVLTFSFVGYAPLDLPVGNKNNVDAVLLSSSKELNEVQVTTSLGIKHPKAELGYAVAQVTAKDLTATNVTNLASGLTAKVSGLAIYTLDNGIDPNISIVLRGNRSLEGNNNALIVLDGVPVPSDMISSINPNDIADVTILKGAGAAALYGSEASNGALLITTKRGTADSKPTIIYQQSFQLEKVAFYPKLQTTFGPYGGEPVSSGYLNGVTNAPSYVPYENQEYGPRYNGAIVPIGAPIPLDSAGHSIFYQPMTQYSAQATSPIESFFKTGHTEQNDISFSQGDAKNSFFMSAQNVYRTDIVPNDANKKNAFSLRGHKTDGMFSIDYSLGYTKTNVSTYGSNYVPQFSETSLYGGVLQLPAFLNLTKQYTYAGQNLGSVSDPNSIIGNPSNYYDAYAVNPYWIVDHTRVTTNRDVVLSNLKLSLDPTKWLTASYRISDNFGIDNYRATQEEVDFSAYSLGDPLGASNIPSDFKGTGKSPGSVIDYSQYGDGTLTTNSPDAGYSRVEGDALLDFHKTFFKDFKTDLLLGNTIWEEYQKEQGIGSSDLLLKDVYNVNYIGGLLQGGEYTATIRQISYYGDFNVSYKGWLTLDATLRNEHDSRLSTAERSFSYPSGKLAFVPTDAIGALKNNKVLDFWKIYASVSRVGNIDIQPYQIQNIYSLAPGFPYGSLGGLTASTESYSPTLKPELTTEVEVGTDLSFFADRINVDLTYYDQKDKNQTVVIYPSVSTGYSSSLLNIGETESSGEEVQLTGDVLTKQNNNVLFRLGANFSNNNSKLISLLPGVNQVSLGTNEVAIVGQPFPLLRTNDFTRDPQGRVVVDPNTGYPSISPVLKNYGRTTPKYNLGLNFTLGYKFVTLTALAEYRGGNVIDNNTGQSLEFTGAGYQTAEAGRQIFVYPNSSIETSPGVYTANTSVAVKDGNYGFWQQSVYSSVNGAFVSSGAFWKLREVTLTFDLNQFINKTHFIKGAQFSLTGRNLFIWVPKSNIYTDPEFSDVNPFSNARGLNDDNITPGTRVFGASLKLTF